MAPAAGTRPRPHLLHTSGRSNHRHRLRYVLDVVARQNVAKDANSLPERRDVRRLLAVADNDVRSLAGLRRDPGTAGLRHRSRD